MDGSWRHSTLSQITLLAVLCYLLAGLLGVIGIIWWHVSIDLLDLILKPFGTLMGTLLTAYLTARQMQRREPMSTTDVPKP